MYNQKAMNKIILQIICIQLSAILKRSIIPILCIIPSAVLAQKKPLDHSVYDQWQSISNKKVSNNGKWFAYTVSPQEGDGETIIQSFDNTYRKVIPRGYSTTITEDSKFAIVKIRAPFKVLREARIKRRMADDMPKDSLAIITFGMDSIVKIPRVKSYKTPENAGVAWLTYLHEKGVNEPRTRYVPDSLSETTSLTRMVDSLLYMADSLRNLAQEIKAKGKMALTVPEKKDSGTVIRSGEEGTELVLKNLLTGADKRFKLVSDYYFNARGTVLISTLR